MEVWLKTEPILLILANPAACLNADSDRGPDTTPPTLPVLQLPRPQNFTPEPGMEGHGPTKPAFTPNLPENLFRGAAVRVKTGKEHTLKLEALNKIMEWTYC